MINLSPSPSPAISNQLHDLVASRRAKASAGSMNGCGSVVSDTCWYSGSGDNQHDAPFRFPSRWPTLRLLSCLRDVDVFLVRRLRIRGIRCSGSRWFEWAPDQRSCRFHDRLLLLLLLCHCWLWVCDPDATGGICVGIRVCVWCLRSPEVVRFGEVLVLFPSLCVSPFLPLSFSLQI